MLSPGVELTSRQAQVLGLLACGRTADEIAGSLGITARTARAHLDALKWKLEVRRARDLPMAYRNATGSDPVSLIDTATSLRLSYRT